ncbi:phosphatase PAP2 family protein [Murimonas intestini]|uniref:phosphatase PAP2 family protein n=1 Tax=Murimonas intestini TaxID=1337051 RepID=UPI0011DD9000|nr:phosphatase PAP2 family protein [Murimonas intestini]
MDFLRLLEGIRTPFLDQIFQFMTYFGQDFLVLGIICLLYWCLNKKLAYEIGLSFFTSGLILQNLKITFRIPRPWVLDPGFKAIPSAIPAATGYSFPSGHTQSATTLFSGLALNIKKTWGRIICIVLFLLVGFSRMYLGVHTPKDVVTAMLIALVVSWLIHRLMASLKNTKKENIIIAIVLAVFSIATACYSLALLGSGTIEEAYAADCCKAAGAGLAFALGWYLEHTYIHYDTKASLSFQAVKFVIGLIVTLLLKTGLKALLGASVPSEMFQYFILVLWIIVIYPFLLTAFTKNRHKKEKLS